MPHPTHFMPSPALDAQKHWQCLLSPQRLGSPKRNTRGETARSQFHKDYDRLVFSQSFRQLNQKTQVHPLTQQMGIHTRLTHSLEVSCIGRSLGMMAAEKLHESLPNGLPRGIGCNDVGVMVQAACLAHDIGNPPFGHAGEYAIRDWFRYHCPADLWQRLTDDQQLDLLAYEGNAQGFRLLVRNEHHPDAGGMRLTCATLGAFMKYPWLSVQGLDAQRTDAQRTDAQGRVNEPSHPNAPPFGRSSPDKSKPSFIAKYGCFLSEADLLDALAQRLHLPKHPVHDGYARHPLAYLLEAADDICYALIDLEDGIHLGMLSYAEVEPIMQALLGKQGNPPEVTNNAPIAQKLAALRGRAMMRLVDKVTEAFIANRDAMLHGEMEGSLFEQCDKHIWHSIDVAKNMARQQIFNHPNKVRMELMANACLHRLLDSFVPLALQPTQTMTFEQKRLLALFEPHLHNHHRSFGTDIYQNVLIVLDYITGLNDHEAYQLSQELSGIWLGA